MAKTISKASQSQGMLMFKLSLTQSFAIGTLKVREIVPFQPMTQLPYSHHHVIGTVTIRDLTVPVIDMSAAVGFRPISPQEYQSCVLIAVISVSKFPCGKSVRPMEPLNKTSPTITCLLAL